MRAVQEADFARAVRRLVVGEEDIEPGGLRREFLFDLGGSFDHEEEERFAAVEELVLDAELFAVFRGVGARIARDDAVDERAAEDALVLDVADDFRIGEVLQDAFAELLPVVLDELAGDEDQAAEAGFRAGGDELRDLRGERVGVGTVFDARLGRVREDEPQVWVQRGFDDLVPLGGGIEAALHAVDLLDLLDHLSVLHAAQDHVVEAALGVDDVAHALRKRLDDLHGGIEHAGFVHAVDHPVDERAQEIALAELEDADGAGQRCFTGQLFHVMCSFQSSETR